MPAWSLSAVLLCVGMPVGPAKAGWDFTSWGMSPTEVREASPVKVSLSRQGERVLKRVTRQSSVLAYLDGYDWHGQRFEVRFGFDAHARLNAVFLLTGATRFAALEAVLAGAHGEPLARAEAPVPCRIWIDRSQGDYVRLSRLGASILERAPVAGNADMRCIGSGRRAEREAQDDPITPRRSN